MNYFWIVAYNVINVIWLDMEQIYIIFRMPFYKKKRTVLIDLYVPVQFFSLYYDESVVFLVGYERFFSFSDFS